MSVSRMEKMAIVLLSIFLFAPPLWSQDQTKKATESHKRAICTEICHDIDVLLYDVPHLHEATASCSYTDERLLIKPQKSLAPDRMTRFVFLSFVAAGMLRNEDLIMPPIVLVGYGKACQQMSTNDAAILQKSAKFPGDSGMYNAMLMAKEAPKVECPK